MHAVKAHYKNGHITLTEPSLPQREAEVLIIFPTESIHPVTDMVIAFQDLHDLIGIINIGGNAVTESDEAYDQ
ncbi:MAG: hypothetical protein HY709_09380 [Candidatus Latescibacteria bacterium]|nr:hypothetical protein [Candidatus Latescibacterota bacterium]